MHAFITFRGEVAQAPSSRTRKTRRNGYTPRMRAQQRLNELERLAHHRIDIGWSIDRPRWLLVAAHCLARLQDGLDYFTLERRMKLAGITASGVEIMNAVHATHRFVKLAWTGSSFPEISAEKAAQLLDVTAEERWICRIRTIGAVDETPAERKARQAEERQEKDRERKRIEREANGARPRSSSNERMKPWVDLGISRSKWYADRSAARTSSSTHNKKLVIGVRTKLSKTIKGAGATAPAKSAGSDP